MLRLLLYFGDPAAYQGWHLVVSAMFPGAAGEFFSSLMGGGNFLAEMFHT